MQQWVDQLFKEGKMPRKPRFYLPGVPVHIVQRGHSREPVFFETADYLAYLGWLKEASQHYNCKIHEKIGIREQLFLI